jgi:hypothetical protein
MKFLLRKSFGIGALVTLLASPAMAQSYYGGTPGYSAPYHRIERWQNERHEAMWRAHERHQAWWHETHHYDPRPWGY